MTMQEFFTKNDHLKLVMQHIQTEYGYGYWKIEIYDTTLGLASGPVFKCCISDLEVENVILSFEDLIMSHILTWYDTWK